MMVGIPRHTVSRAAHLEAWKHQVPISSPGSLTHGQAHAAHRREPQKKTHGEVVVPISWKYTYTIHNVYVCIYTYAYTY